MENDRRRFAFEECGGWRRRFEVGLSIGFGWQQCKQRGLGQGKFVAMDGVCATEMIEGEDRRCWQPQCGGV